MPQSKINRPDPLESPYIEGKLAKIQSFHVERENLLDRLHKAAIGTGGTQRDIARNKPKHPGPRTKNKKRTFSRQTEIIQHLANPKAGREIKR